jgi:nicotinamide mononucleotide adenylyltransferase
MSLSLQDGDEVILLCGWAQTETATEFDSSHPERNPTPQLAIAKLLKKIRKHVQSPTNSSEHPVQHACAYLNF